MESQKLYDRFTEEETDFQLVGTYKKRVWAQIIKYWIVVNKLTGEEFEYTTKNFELIFKRL